MDTTLNYKPVYIEMTDDSPHIFLDAENSVFKIEGPSYPEDAHDVYKVVLEWISKVNDPLKSKLNCDFNFKILSSASHKMIYEILIGLESLHKKSNNVVINWYYQEFDEDMYETGEDYADTIDIPFKLFPLESL